jgi:hypothetical protein
MRGSLRGRSVGIQIRAFSPGLHHHVGLKAGNDVASILGAESADVVGMPVRRHHHIQFARAGLLDVRGDVKHVRFACGAGLCGAAEVDQHVPLRLVVVAQLQQQTVAESDVVGAQPRGVYLGHVHASLALRSQRWTTCASVSSSGCVMVRML